MPNWHSGARYLGMVYPLANLSLNTNTGLWIAKINKLIFHLLDCNSYSIGIVKSTVSLVGLNTWHCDCMSCSLTRLYGDRWGKPSGPWYTTWLLKNYQRLPQAILNEPYFSFARRLPHRLPLQHALYSLWNQQLVGFETTNMWFQVMKFDHCNTVTVGRVSSAPYQAWCTYWLQYRNIRYKQF